MKDNALYNSRIIKTFVEYLGAYYPGLDINSILDHSGMTVYQLNDDLAASCRISKLKGY